MMLTIDSPRMLGVLFTTWSGEVVPDLRPALLGEGDPMKLDETIRRVAESMRVALPRLRARGQEPTR